MKAGPQRPPPAAEKLLSRLLRRETVDDTRAELAELFSLRADRNGVHRARLWYWRQVLGFAMRLRSLRRADAAPSRPVTGTPRSSSSRPARMSLRVGGWLSDIRLAARSLRRSPGFTAVVLVTLGLGIGANTAIFSVVYGTLLRPLPYADVGRLVWLSDGHERFGTSGANISVPNFVDLQEQSRLLEAASVYKVRSGNLSSDEQPQRVVVLYASSTFLDVLGVVPRLGRDLVTGDDVAGSQPVALLTDGLWRSRFAADPGVVGTMTIVNAQQVMIVGVLPPEFTFPDNPQMLMALRHLGATGLLRGNRGHFGIARMAAGTDRDSLTAELRGISAALAAAYPEANDGFFTSAEPLRDHAVARNRQALLLTAGAVTLVLLIACVNVANLMLARAATRQRELSLRYALGATRAGMASLFLSEGMLLSSCGGVLGLLVAQGGVPLLVSRFGNTLPRAHQVELNGTVLAFTLAVSIGVGTLVGIVPLLRSRPDETRATLQDGARGSSLSQGRTGRVLVVVEIALAVLIVVAAGLLSNSLWRLTSADLGLHGEQEVLTFRLELPNSKYRAASIGALYDELLARLRGEVGVEAAALVNRLPLLGGDNMNLQAYGDSERTVDFVSYRMVSDQYFEAVGAVRVAGKLLDAADHREGTGSVVINETLARQMFDGDVIGGRIEDPMFPPGADGYLAEGLEVVGVIHDIVGGRVDAPPPAAYYFPLSRGLRLLAAYEELAATEQIAMSVLVRATRDPYALVPRVRRIVRDLDPDVPVFAVQTLADVAADRLGTRRFAMSLFGVFAGLALILGAVGVYGVMSFRVAHSARELGVRMALGASPASVLRQVLSEVARLAAPGIAIGLLAALGVTRLLGGLLYEVSPTDPATYVVVAGILGLVCFAAAYLPARRATRIDPLVSMRVD